MRTSRVWCLFVGFICLGLSSPLLFSYGQQHLQTNRLPAENSPSLIRLRVPEATTVGIREDIPERYKRRYEDWKKEFLSTETGHQQWNSYAKSSGFLLTITIVRENRNGATTGKYKWDDSGKLVAATILLGNSLDDGYPNPIYYPVQNSLSPSESSYPIDRGILAATKIAHEFGHVNRMKITNSEQYRLQTQLVPVYNSILLRNGYNTKDPRLIALARQMGGTPIELWEDREYWGEANAMLFLRDRITKESFRCTLFRRIETSVQLYAKNYEERFIQIAQPTFPAESCGR
jgi:YD repeat-containing protein